MALVESVVPDTIRKPAEAGVFSAVLGADIIEVAEDEMVLGFVGNEFEFATAESGGRYAWFDGILGVGECNEEWRVQFE